MPFVAPLVAGATALEMVGQAIVGIGLSFGMSYIAKKLQPQSSTSATAAQGMQLSLSYDPNGPRQWPFGTCASAGTLIYHNSYGPNGNDYLQLACKLGDVPCDSIVSLRVDGKSCTVSGSSSDGNVTGSNVSNYSGNLWVKFHEGDWSQAADSDLVNKASGTAWSSNNRGRGVCYMRLTAKYDAEKFKNGRPNVLAIFKGATLYDWRKDSTNGGSGSHRFGTLSTYEWSDNPAVILYNYMRGIYVNGMKIGGMNVPAANLPVDVWTAAANACDETVSLKAGGTEKRYRANGIRDLTGEHASFIRDLLATMAGQLVDCGGDFKLYAGVAKTSVITLTDADLVVDKEVTYSPRLSRTALVNAVFGSFTDPSKDYQSMSLPPRVSPTDQTADGGVQLTENYGLSYVCSGTQGQRILEIYRRRGRYQRAITVTLRPRFYVLEAGDWVTFNSDRYGLSGVTFEVVQAQYDANLVTTLELREVSSSIYTWTPAKDELNPLNPANVGSGNAKFTTVSGIALASILVEGNGSQQTPGLSISWTEITDQTVASLTLQYRKVGDTEALTKTIFDLSTSTYQWTEGIQGDLQYEARLIPNTQPVRATTWSGWAQAPVDTPPQVVSIATAVPPDTITDEMLSEQTRLELSLTTAVDSVLGSVTNQVKRLSEAASQAHIAAIESILTGTDNAAQIREERIQRVAEDLVLAQQITTISAQLNDNVLAAIQEEQTARATADDSLASSIATTISRLGSNEVAVTVLQESINGLEGRWGIAINANGQIVGLVQLDASAVAGSTFTVVAGNFRIAQPGVTGGDPIQVFAIQTVNGVTKLALRGDMIADGTIKARHIDVVTLSAISADFGSATFTGIIRGGPTGKLIIDLNNGRIRGTA